MISKGSENIQVSAKFKINAAKRSTDRGSSRMRRVNMRIIATRTTLDTELLKFGFNDLLLKSVPSCLYTNT